MSISTAHLSHLTPNYFLPLLAIRTIYLRWEGSRNAKKKKKTELEEMSYFFRYFFIYIERLSKKNLFFFFLNH
uniref:Uncharacterized protein n=1 Tax=Lepeophtheirus salmonis TaxID=72036 RepID=A0A0K2UR16_LEPSM